MTNAPHVLSSKREHVKWLSEFFNLSEIHEDCDYQQIRDKYEPNAARGKSGVRPQKAQIRSAKGS